MAAVPHADGRQRCGLFQRLRVLLRAFLYAPLWHLQDQDVRVVALVANSQGYVYKRAEQDCPAGSGQIPLDCTGLRKGQYIIYIHADGDKYAEKVNFK